MKYKVLINYGENDTMLNDFFQYTKDYFTTITTSELWQDVIGHFEYFKPDVYLILMENAYCDAISQIGNLRSHKLYNGAPIIVIGKKQDCIDFEHNFPQAADFIIRRPISADNIALSIIAFVEKGHQEIRDENAKKRILIVDDDRTILKMVKTALEKEYDVTAMLNGTLVEKFLSTNEVDLIILDYEMPIMNGAAVYRQIKGNPKTAKIPVCFLTGVSERYKVEEIMSLRPRGYLLKPLNMELLMTTVTNLA